MNTPTPPDTDAGGSPIEELTRQRTLLQQWLARLDELSPEAPPHVAARVRSDYLVRLRVVTEQLGSHREALAEDLRARRADLDRAEARLAEARDALEEAQLRHRIGELAEGEWTARRPELARAVETAEGEVEGMREEVERLDSLLAETSGGSEAPPAPSSGDDTLPEYQPPARPAAPPPLPAAEEVEGVDLGWLAEIGSAPAAPAAPPAGAAPPAAPDPTADDLAFLEELDRAIAGSTTPPPAAADPDRTLDADRAGMLLCKECGAINEPGAWYCEICGSEL